MPEFTPERARRYVADSFPQLMNRVTTHLGDPMPDGTQHPDPTPEVARLALLSAKEILSVLGPLLSPEDRAPFEAQLAALSKRFRTSHPDLPLRIPQARPAMNLIEAVQEAWDSELPATRDSVLGDDILGLHPSMKP